LIITADLTVRPDWVEPAVVGLVYLTMFLGLFLLARDVIQTRRKTSKPISQAWVLIALFFPIGTLAWILYRRDLMATEKRSHRV
jgi:hypothetical protein